MCYKIKWKFFDKNLGKQRNPVFLFIIITSNQLIFNTTKSRRVCPKCYVKQNGKFMF